MNPVMAGRAGMTPAETASTVSGRPAITRSAADGLRMAPADGTDAARAALRLRSAGGVAGSNAVPAPAAASVTPPGAAAGVTPTCTCGRPAGSLLTSCGRPECRRYDLDHDRAIERLLDQ